jgi:hypothetical protein
MHLISHNSSKIWLYTQVWSASIGCLYLLIMRTNQLPSLWRVPFLALLLKALPTSSLSSQNFRCPQWQSLSEYLSLMAWLHLGPTIYRSQSCLNQVSLTIMPQSLTYPRASYSRTSTCGPKPPIVTKRRQEANCRKLYRESAKRGS